MTIPPTALKPLLDNIPAELKLLPQWVNWRFEQDEKRKWKKSPHDPKNGRRASHSDPATWGTFEQAVARDPNHIGFVFTLKSGYIGFDQDHCVENHVIQAEARARMMELNTYTEYSPSGTGLHSILRGSISKSSKQPWGEMYSSSRYFTFTGHVLAGYDVIQERDAEAFRLKYFSDSCRAQVELTGGRVVKKLQSRLQKQLDTPSDPSAEDKSEQDFACIIGLLQAGISPADCKATFLASARGEDAKARKPNVDYYVEHSIKRALDKLALRFFYHDASEPPIEVIEYLFEHHTIPLAMLTYLYGPKGTGKTKFCDYLTARATQNGTTVIRFNLEDPERAILIPNMYKAGVDLKLVKIPEGIGAEGTSLADMDLSQSEHLSALEQLILEVNSKLVIIEPVNRYKGSAKANSEDDMRRIYDGLARIAGNTGAAIIAVGHTNKRTDGSVLDKAMGDASHTRVARQIILVQRDQVATDLVRVMDAYSNVPMKQNRVFKIVEQPEFLLKNQLIKNVAIAVMVDDVEDKSADEVLDESRTLKKSTSDLIAAFLLENLKGRGWVSTRVIERECHQENPDWKFSMVKVVFSRRKLGQVSGGGTKTHWKIESQLPLVNGHANGAEIAQPAIAADFKNGRQKDYEF